MAKKNKEKKLIGTATLDTEPKRLPENLVPVTGAEIVVSKNMEETKKTTGRGGRREGSGRPVGERSKSVCLRLSPESLAILKQQPNQSEFVDELIKAAKD
jgi:hypothetical protein